MALDKVREFFESLKTNPEIKQLVEALPKAEKPEDAVKAYASIAAKLGVDLTEEDFVAAFKEAEASTIKSTDEAAKKVGAIADDELEAVAGGVIDHGDACYSDWQCHKTYEDYENCLSNDACDNAVTSYSGYLCYWENRGTCNLIAISNW